MIKLLVDSSSSLAVLGAMSGQLPYAISRALNLTANDAQEAQRQQMRKSFRLKREQFNLRGVYISKSDRADKSTWRVVIQIGQKQDYLAKFEQGGQKLPTAGRKHIAVPNKAVFGGRALKPGDPLRPKNLHLKTTPTGQVKGDQRTFVVAVKGGQKAILQRVDKDASGKLSRGARTKGGKKHNRKRRVAGGAVRVLFWLDTQVPIAPILHWETTMTSTSRRVWPVRFEEAMRYALRTMR